MFGRFFNRCSCFQTIHYRKIKKVKIFFVRIYILLYSQICIKTKKTWSYKTGDFLKVVQFRWIFLWQDKKKGDLLPQVTTWAGVSVLVMIRCNISLLIKLGVKIMVFNVTFNNISVISWRSVLLVEETGLPRENHQPPASHW